MRKIGLILIACSIFSLPSAAQESLTNESIVKMVKAGISDELVISTIKSKLAHFDASVDGIIALKTAGVSDKVVAAIVAKDADARQTHAPDTPSLESNSTPASVIPSTTPQAIDNASQKSDLGSATGQQSGPIQPGARVVIAPMGGFETYFAAAVREKKVPIALTLDRATAQYFIVSTETEWRGFVAGSGTSADWNAAGGHLYSGSSASSTRGLESSIMLIDSKSKDVIWAYEVHKSSHGALLFGTLAARGQQSLAEACAKHLKEFIEKGK